MTLLLILAGCTAETGTPALSPCEEEDRAPALQVGDTFDGDLVTVEVLALNPDPVVVGRNTWALGLTGASDCEATLTPWMPDHGHSSPVGAVSVEADEVAVEDLQLSMGGYWELTLGLECASTSEEVVVGLCVDA